MVMSVLRSKKFAKRVLIALLILIIPAFVLWGVGNLSSGPGIIGTIGSKKITADEFLKSIKGIRAQVLFSYYGDPKTLSAILNNRQMLNHMAWERLVFLDATNNKNIKVTNNDVMTFISQHPLFQRGGGFDRQLYDYLLRNTFFLEPRQFEELIRENLRIKVLRRSILGHITVTDRELEEYFHKTNDAVSLSYLFVPSARFTDTGVVSVEEARAYFDQNRFMSAPRVEAEYIEFPYASAAEKKEVMQKIEALYPALRKSSSFSGTAAENGLTAKKTGPFSREQVIPGIPFFKKFHDTAFSLEKGEVSRPIASSDTDSGAVYILVKSGDLPPSPLQFEEVQSALMDFLAEKKRLSEAEQTARDLYDKMSSGETTMKEAAAELETRVQTTSPVTASGYIDNVGPAGQIVIASLAAGEGNLIPPVLLQKGVFLGRVDNITPADTAVFEKDKDALRNKLQTRKQIQAIDAWFRENADRINLKKNLDTL